MFDDLNNQDNKAQNQKHTDGALQPKPAAAPNQPSTSDMAPKPVQSIPNTSGSNTPPPAPNKSPEEKRAELEDIFSETESVPTPPAEKPDAFKPKQASEPLKNKSNISNKSKIKIILIIVFGVIFLGAGGFFGYRYLMQYLEKDIQVLEENQETVEPEAIEQNNNINNTDRSNTAEQKTPPPVVNIDTDNDGLTDEQEKALGTDINKTDTDYDGLSDREEVRVYNTNPLDPDTDGDSFADGTEVEKGYNPNGEGRLYEIN